MARPVSFYDAFSKEERMAMTREDRKRLSKQYQEKEYCLDTKTFTKNKHKYFGIMMRHKETGKLLGEVEHSFSMDWSPNEVRMYNVCYYRLRSYNNEKFSYKQYADAKAKLSKDLTDRVQQYQEKYPEYDVFLISAGKKNCPVKLDWQSHKNAKSKYDHRNVKFKIKG